MVALIERTENGFAEAWALTRLRGSDLVRSLAPAGVWNGAAPQDLVKDGLGNVPRYVIVLPLAGFDDTFGLRRAITTSQYRIVGRAEDGDLATLDALAFWIDQTLDNQVYEADGFRLTARRSSPFSATFLPLGKRYDERGGIYELTIRHVG